MSHLQRAPFLFMYKRKTGTGTGTTMTIELSKELQEAVTYARAAKPTQARAFKALHALDLTSLRGNETKADIRDLVMKAELHHLASVCVMPRKVRTARAARAFNSSVKIATVTNFPDGIHLTGTSEIATPLSTAEAIIRNNRNGANQNDIVLDFEGFLAASISKNSVKLEQIGSLLQSCRDNAGTSTMKIIIGTAAFNDSTLLREACEFSAGFGPDCLKTDTGFHPNGGATLEKTAIMMQVAKEYGLGVKISAGVKDEFHAAQYQALAEAIFGYDISSNPNIFRIGASSVLPRLENFARNGKVLETNPGDVPSPQY